MRLDRCTWIEIESYLSRSCGIIIPIGSNEQHGPIGLIGTDAICAEAIATGAATTTGALVAPTLCYTPAPFNMAFPGTVSLSENVFSDMVGEIIDGLAAHGFKKIYFLNGHGANLELLKRQAERVSKSGQTALRIRSWWDFDQVNELREAYYGDWEGMHATPSEIAITQATDRTVISEMADTPPQKLSPEYIRAHAGDKHGPPLEHRADFPDGRVGSHSALARPEHGKALLKAAVSSVAEDYLAWNSN